VCHLLFLPITVSSLCRSPYPRRLDHHSNIVGYRQLVALLLSPSLSWSCSNNSFKKCSTRKRLFCLDAAVLHLRDDHCECAAGLGAEYCFGFQKRYYRRAIRPELSESEAMELVSLLSLYKCRCRARFVPPLFAVLLASASQGDSNCSTASLSLW
jgi:hypothetical protein